MTVLFPRETKAAIECLLFVSKEPVSVKNLAQILEVSEEDCHALVRELQQEYLKQERGIQLREIANGFQMSTRSEFAPYIEQLYKPQTSYGLSRAALETLAIIAYKQPITRAEVEAIRGVKIDSSLGTLVEKNLVREMGRKDGPGRPMLFGTTPAFLKYFGLRDLVELPDPEDFVALNAPEEQIDMESEEGGRPMEWEKLKNLAVVGLSDNPERPSYRVAQYMQGHGFKIIPVNPAVEKVLGEKAYPELKDIPADIQVDVVDIFRKSEAVGPIVEQAVERGGVKLVWMQEGVVNEPAAARARQAGMAVVMDLCIKKEHARDKFCGK